MPARIMVVEDEFIVAKSIMEALNKLGYEVVGTFATGEEAVEAASRLRPDLVIMDIQLKGHLDGVRAAQRIQPLLNIPVVYLTAHSDTDTLKRVVFSHAYGYMNKPFTTDELKAGIEKALNRHRQQSQQKTNTLRSFEE